MVNNNISTSGTPLATASNKNNPSSSTPQTTYKSTPIPRTTTQVRSIDYVDKSGKSAGAITLTGKGIYATKLGNGVSYGNPSNVSATSTFNASDTEKLVQEALPKPPTTILTANQLYQAQLKSGTPSQQQEALGNLYTNIATINAQKTIGRINRGEITSSRYPFGQEFGSGSAQPFGKPVTAQNVSEFKTFLTPQFSSTENVQTTQTETPASNKNFFGNVDTALGNFGKKLSSTFLQVDKLLESGGEKILKFETTPFSFSPFFSISGGYKDVSLSVVPESIVSFEQKIPDKNIYTTYLKAGLDVSAELIPTTPLDFQLYYLGAKFPKTALGLYEGYSTYELSQAKTPQERAKAKIQMAIPLVVEYSLRRYGEYSALRKYEEELKLNEPEKYFEYKKAMEGAKGFSGTSPKVNPIDLTRLSQLEGYEKAQLKLTEYFSKNKNLIVGGSIAQQTQLEKGFSTKRPADIDVYLTAFTERGETKKVTQVGEDIAYLLKEAGVKRVSSKEGKVTIAGEKLFEAHPFSSYLQANIEQVTPFYKPSSFGIKQTPEGINVLSLEVQLKRKIIGGYLEPYVSGKTRLKDIPAYKTIEKSLSKTLNIRKSASLDYEKEFKVFSNNFDKITKPKGLNTPVTTEFKGGKGGGKGIGEFYPEYKPSKYKPFVIPSNYYPSFKNPKVPLNYIPSKYKPTTTEKFIPKIPNKFKPTNYIGTPSKKNLPIPEKFSPYLPTPTQRKRTTEKFNIDTYNKGVTDLFKRKGGKEDIAISPSFTAQVLGIKQYVKKSELYSLASKERTGAELRGILVIK